MIESKHTQQPSRDGRRGKPITGLVLYGLPWLLVLLAIPVKLHVTRHWATTDQIGAAYVFGVGGGLLILLMGVVLWRCNRRRWPNVLWAWLAASIAMFLLFELEW